MAGIRGGAIYFAGDLAVAESEFIGNIAGEDGLAIGSAMCGSPSVQLEGVHFAKTGLYCPKKL